MSGWCAGMPPFIQSKTSTDATTERTRRADIYVAFGGYGRWHHFYITNRSSLRFLFFFSLIISLSSSRDTIDRDTYVGTFEFCVFPYSLYSLISNSSEYASEKERYRKSKRANNRDESDSDRTIQWYHNFLI